MPLKRIITTQRSIKLDTTKEKRNHRSEVNLCKMAESRSMDPQQQQQSAWKSSLPRRECRSRLEEVLLLTSRDYTSMTSIKVCDFCRQIRSL